MEFNSLLAKPRLPRIDVRARAWYCSVERTSSPLSFLALEGLIIEYPTIAALLAGTGS